MNKPVIGLIGVCSHCESGGQRYDELIQNAKAAMVKQGMDVKVAKTAVYTVTDALCVCDQLKADGIEAVAIMDVTWVCDSLKYIFIHELNVPTVFWAVPYTETFSIGCVQNFGSVLKTEGIQFEYVYGMPEEADVVEKVKKVAVAGQLIKKINTMRLALLGPRQTWRVAGPQDMTVEEWEFSLKFGPTLVHMEMEEITDEAEKISDNDAEKVFESLKDHTGKVLCRKETMIWMTKVYMATKRMMEKTGIEVIAAECYPKYGGLMNQTSSWIEEDGYILDTEGDIAHAVVKYVLNAAAQGGCCALGEIGSYSDEENYLKIAHEGSTPASLAESIDQVQVSPSGENGCFVGTPLKPMEHCTVCDLQGTAGNYQMLVANGSVLPAAHEEWVNGGEKLLVKLRLDGVKPSEAVKKMIDAGLHHHIVVKEGDFAEQMQIICKYLGINVITL